MLEGNFYEGTRDTIEMFGTLFDILQVNFFIYQ